jgi:hypothetical protein
MIPKEKAIQLRDKFYFNTTFADLQDAKECALIVVDEILNHHSIKEGLYKIDTYGWQEVKNEIKKL